VIEAVTGDLVKRHEGKQAASKFLKISSTLCKGEASRQAGAGGRVDTHQ
jgi:hypothetical protein